MFQDLTIEELLALQKKQELVFVDVRSPQEFNDATIPKSINIPLFDDEERKEIGTLYKQVSIETAKEKGLEIVSAKLPSFIKQFAAIPQKKVVYCWRGGMRSKVTATTLSLMGIHVYRITGGFRAYRKWVLQELEQFTFKPHCIVINGYTGSGKTKILHQLAGRGHPVIDLEGLAQHRGSIFGQIGLEPNNQKSFEALLVTQLHKINSQPYVIIEAESKRVGKVVIPEFLMQAKEKGTQLFLHLPSSERVQSIMEDYNPMQHKAVCLASFLRIEKRMHTPIAKLIKEHLQQDQYEEAIALLLEYYYDPKYEYAQNQYTGEKINITVDSAEEAIPFIEQQISTLFAYPQ